MSAQALPLDIKPLSQVERVADTFVAPSKTFTDILRSSSWWLPFLLSSLCTCLFAYVILHKIGVPTLVESTLHSSARMEDQIAQATPEQAARMRLLIGKQFQYMYIAPVFLAIFGLISAAVLLAIANFGFGGRATYARLLAVWFYGTLPLLFMSILTVITIYAGMTADNFNIKDPVGTNVGYYLSTTAAPRWLQTLLSSVDVLAIWSAILLSLGVSIVAGIKRSSAAITVFGSWLLYVVLQTAFAAISG